MSKRGQTESNFPLIGLHERDFPPSGRTDPQISHANQIVGRNGKGENPLDPDHSPVAGFAQASYRLEPPEYLLYSLALAQADSIALMTGRAAIDCGVLLLTTWGMTLFARHFFTNSLVSYALSAATVARLLPGISSIISRAASRSQVPVAWVTSPSTAKPLRFSISTWPVKESLASLPLPFLARRASGSVVEAWVALERFSPWKSTSSLRPWAGGSSEGDRLLDENSSSMPKLP